MKKYIALSFIALGLGLTSCNDYLDKLPDDRAELNSQDKVTKFLVSAYVNHLPDFIFEISSDNVLDNGATYTAQPNQDKIYRWQGGDAYHSACEARSAGVWARPRRLSLCGHGRA